MNKSEIIRIPEIERRFLLKKRPILNYNHIYEIIQYYIMVDGNVKRLRYSRDLLPAPVGKEPTLEYVRKVYQNTGECIEEHESITADDYHELVKASFKRLTKKRFVYEYNGLKFEIDEIDNIKLEILEIELTEITQDITFPPEIEREIIKEITGFDSFSNYKLADNIL